MSQPVILKSNRYGINLILDDSLPFQELLHAIVVKFQESEKFFKNADMAISFEGRQLSTEEEYKIVESITQNTSIHIVCILDNDKLKEQMMKKGLEDYLGSQADNTGRFFTGTLRSGQVMESSSSLVIIGDVNPGARVIASGNIVVVGELKGNAFAGANGNERSFVAALHMDPMQIRIGSAIGRSSDNKEGSWTFKPLRRREKETASEPQVARVIEGNIIIEPITKGLLNNI